jgi:hypothetical protein
MDKTLLAKYPKLKFKKMDTIDTPENGCFSFGLIGSTRSGKSVAMLWLWENYFKEHITLMSTGSAQADIYKPLKKCGISPAFYPEILIESMTLNQKTNNKYKFLHIIDDMLDGKNSKALSKLLCIGRNNGQSTIICGQDITIINSVGRTNLNYVMLFRLNSLLSVEKVVKTYLRHILPGKIDDQIKTYVELTQNHYCFVVDFLANDVFITKINIDEVPGI